MSTWGARDESHRVHLGYRYVDREKVLIYARAGRKLAKAAGNVVPAEPAEGDEKNWVIEGPLTDIRASYTSLGEGAYLVPNLGAWEGRYVCEVWADSEKFKTSPKFLVDETTQDFPSNDKAWDRMLSKYHKTMDRTIIAARLPRVQVYAMRIPPRYLPPSSWTVGSLWKPKSDLGITVRCVAKRNLQALTIRDPVNWGQWWPKLNSENSAWMNAIGTQYDL
ncbi:uncharacterized protein C8R40DRAFT_1102729, partial [Lentinula edodes]|uniref:uncharacterized protein n=1 Tax=Lentinula edodes TaxID=5353 RepID=UPI001E8E690C